MADNITTQSATPATLPASTKVAAVVGGFAGDTDAAAGVGVLAEVSGAEGSRVLTVLGLAKSGATLTSVPTTLTTVTNFGGSTEYRMDGVLVVNSSGAAITFGLTNGSDQYIAPPQDVPARDHRIINLNGAPITGLKWVAGGSGLLGLAWGRTAQ